MNFEKIDIPALPDGRPTSISNVNLVHLFDDNRMDLLACDMRRGQILALQPYTGEILLMENETTDWTKPKFVPRVRSSWVWRRAC